MAKYFVKKKKGKVYISVINTNRKDAILDRDMLVASLSSVDCIKKKVTFQAESDISSLSSTVKNFIKGHHKI